MFDKLVKVLSLLLVSVIIAAGIGCGGGGDTWGDGDGNGGTTTFSADEVVDNTLQAQDDIESFRFEIESHFQPVIEAIHRRAQLSKAALWRLVADAIAGRFLDSGRRFGNVETAKAAAMTILKVPGSPLANRQLCYFDLTVLNKNQQEFSYTFRQRGGCCRYYQIEPGHMCPTCVLKTPEERDEELRLAMRQHLGVA